MENIRLIFVMLATFSISENYNSQTLTFLRMQAPGRCLFIDAKSEYRLFLTGSKTTRFFPKPFHPVHGKFDLLANRTVYNNLGRV